MVSRAVRPGDSQRALLVPRHSAAPSLRHSDTPTLLHSDTVVLATGFRRGEHSVENHTRPTLAKKVNVMKPGSLKSVYVSCPQLEKVNEFQNMSTPASLDDKALNDISDKYDSYQGYIDQCHTSLSSSEDDQGAAIATGVYADDGRLTDNERMQVETFFRSLKTQVYVCGSMVKLYFGSSSSENNWELKHSGIPVLILDTGEARSRVKRRIQILLAERGTCFTLWQDTIDNLTSYRVADHQFHTMHLSSDHTCLVGFSFDSAAAASEMWSHVDRLTSSPENISLSIPGQRKQRRSNKPQPLPAKSHISHPCCFQHIISIDAGDRSRYFSLQTLVPILSSQNKKQGTGV